MENKDGGRGCFSSNWVTLEGLFEKLTFMLSPERLKQIIKDKQKKIPGKRVVMCKNAKVGRTSVHLTSF